MCHWMAMQSALPAHLDQSCWHHGGQAAVVHDVYRTIPLVFDLRYGGTTSLNQAFFD